MPFAPVFIVNSPTSGTTYLASMGYGAIPTSGTTVSCNVQAWTGANGTGSLVAVTTLESIVRDVTTATNYTHTGSSENTDTVSHVAANSTDRYMPGGMYTGGAIGSLTIQLTYTGTAYIPSVTSFTPTFGAAGTSVVITGTNFFDAPTVQFNGVNAASFTRDSETQITAVVPTGATTGPISVANASGTGTSAASFTVGQAYINTGTPASPVWTAGTVYINTGTPASPTWTPAQGVFVNTGTPGAPVWTPGG